MPLEDRLAALREADAAAVAPLWIEALRAPQALAALVGREGPVFDLQRARFLVEAGRPAEAAEILEGLGHLPEGLAAVKERTCASARLAAGAGRQGPAAAGARLESWLDRVNRWRSELRV